MQTCQCPEWGDLYFYGPDIEKSQDKFYVAMP